MSYIGNTPTTQAFAPAIDYFSGNGSTVAFTLSRPVASVAQVQVFVNNVPQNPSTAFTVSNQTLTFTGAPSSGTNNIYVEYTSPITQVQGLTQSPSVIGPMYVAINGATPLGGATNPILGTSGSANNYVQSYVLNQTNGANSSADFTAYPSNGTDAAGWVDIGITSLGYSSTTYSITGPNESYLFGSGPTGTTGTGNLVIATDSTGTANDIQFYTGGFSQAKSAAKMVIQNSTGYVGIGTSSPTEKCHIYASSGNAFYRFQNAATGSGASDGGFVGIGSSGDVYLYNYETSNTIFATNNAERMRIDSSGNLMVGTTSRYSSERLSVSNTGTNDVISVGTAGGTGYVYRTSTSSGLAAYFITSAGQAGLISCSGATTSYTSGSDYRLKDNIRPLTNALGKVAALKPVAFEWKSNGGYGESFVAHELAEVCPQAVHGEKDAVDADGNPKYQGIDTSFLVATLTAAIQEQQALITSLTERIAALEAK